MYGIHIDYALCKHRRDLRCLKKKREDRNYLNVETRHLIRTMAGGRSHFPYNFWTVVFLPLCYSTVLSLVFSVINPSEDPRLRKGLGEPGLREPLRTMTNTVWREIRGDKKNLVEKGRRKRKRKGEKEATGQVAVGQWEIAYMLRAIVRFARNRNAH